MKITRRQFLGSAAAVAAVSIVPRHVLGGPKFVPPSEKVNIALVGAGGQGQFNVRALFQEPDAQVVAVADPAEYWDLNAFHYQSIAGRKSVTAEIEKHYAEKTPNFRCAEYADFRDLLEKEKGIDAVLCATPDHLHACVCVRAMRGGKHVYCEKPLTHNLWEARVVAQTARETGVATQMGNAGHSREGIRRTVEYLRDGVIGPVHEVHSWIWAGRYNPTLLGKPTDAAPVPAGLNWDLWLGPRPSRPFHPAYVPVKWRDFWSFGSGSLGDFASHDVDVAVWAFELGLPQSVQVRPVAYTDAEIVPQGEIGYFHFPARGPQPPLKVCWYGGGPWPDRPAALPANFDLSWRGTLFLGEKGVIECDGAGGPPRLFPEALRTAYRPPAKTLPRSKGHHRDWLDAIKGGPPAGSCFEIGAHLTEIALLGVLSLRMGGRRIEWDSQNQKVQGVPEAEAYIKETYRPGWEVM
jgi:predicted dehydrogenase